MIILGILRCIAAIGILYWLLFTLAIFALRCSSASAQALGPSTPVLAGLARSSCILAAGLTLGVGQNLLGLVRPM
jgi:hypothetical protein